MRVEDRQGQKGLKRHKIMIKSEFTGFELSEPLIKLIFVIGMIRYGKGKVHAKLAKDKKDRMGVFVRTLIFVIYMISVIRKGSRKGRKGQKGKYGDFCQNFDFCDLYD